MTSVKIEPNADAAAGLASDAALELPVEQVDDDALIAPQMILPGLSRHFVIRPAVRVLELDVRLDLDAVQVLVKSVEQESEELLSVVLLETGELRSVFA